MCVRQVRGAVILFGAVLAQLGIPTQSYALFDWLCPTSGYYRGTAVTSYEPPFTGRPMAWAPRYGEPPWRPAVPLVAAAPAVAPTATTCCYVPTTFYRTEYRMVPTTTCQAVSYYEPCSGCPMVTYRPVTSWAYRPQLVPYNTYRIVYSAPATTCVGAPSASYGVATPLATSGPGCASCGRAAPAPAVISPMPSSTSTVLPPPSLPGPLPITSQPMTVQPSTSQPSTFAPWQGGQTGTSRYGTMMPPNGSPSTSSGSSAGPAGQSSPATGSPTRPNGSPGAVAPAPQPGPVKALEKVNPPATQERLKPTPDSNTGPGPGRMPTLGTPQGRTAQRPIVRPAVYVQPVSSRSQVGSPVPPRLDTSGWEAAGN
jgi:hypothetical protein